MITIISGTNRADSMTLRTARAYQEIFTTLNTESQIFSLEGKNVWDRTVEMHLIEQEFLIPSQKFVFIMPEYNASFPGILKTMMDNSDIKKCWWHKKAMLTGISDGRAGNLRGIEHMTSILNYLKVNVLYNKVLLSKISEEISKDATILKEGTATLIEQQCKEFITF